ncbi:hypothetical protein D9M68_882960 [compost metagenome]
MAAPLKLLCVSTARDRSAPCSRLPMNWQRTRVRPERSMPSRTHSLNTQLSHDPPSQATACRLDFMMTQKLICTSDNLAPSRVVSKIAIRSQRPKFNTASLAVHL